MLLTADGFLRKGQAVPMKARPTRGARGRVRSVRETVVAAAAGEGAAAGERDWSAVDRRGRREPLDAERLDTEHPLFIGYTSGTTGRPKGVLHVHGGFLVKIAEEVAYQVDLHPGEVLHWVTDLGWIMGPWEIVGALALGATVLLYDGAPTHPGPDRLWALVERHGITTLGVSPTLIRALIPSGPEPSGARPVLAPHPRVDRRAVEPRPVPVAASGGRRRSASRSSTSRAAPRWARASCRRCRSCALKPCTLRGPALGMDVDIVDAGRARRSAPARSASSCAASPGRR